MERPREGGSAMSCSQIDSRHFSLSSAPAGGAGASVAGFSVLSAVTAFADFAGAGFSAGVTADCCAAGTLVADGWVAAAGGAAGSTGLDDGSTVERLSG